MVVPTTASGEVSLDDTNWRGYISKTVGTYGIEIDAGGIGSMSFTEVKLGGWATTRRLIQPVAGTGASINGNTLTAGCYTIDDLALVVISPETIAGSASVTASYALTIER